MAEFRGFLGDFHDSPGNLRISKSSPHGLRLFRLWNTLRQPVSLGILLVVSLMIVSVSCGNRDQSQAEREKALRERVEEQSKRVEEAKHESQRVQQEVIRAKQEKGLWIGLGLAGVIISLVIGTAMGSKARRDAKNQRRHSEKEDNVPKEREANREKGGDPIQGKSGSTEGGDPIDGKPEPK